MPKLEKLTYYAKVLYAMKVGKVTTSYMPEYIAIEVTNVCNFKCEFCPQSNPNHHNFVPKTYLDEEKCNLFLTKIRRSGIKTNIIHWTLDGEPFMNKQFHKLFNVAVAHGFNNAHFATNGMLCTTSRISQLPVDECRLTLAIDFCADKEYFERVRGVANSWEKILKNIISILQNKEFRNVFIEITDISSFSVSDKQQLTQNYIALKELFVNSKNTDERIIFRKRTFHNATGTIDKMTNVSQGAKYHLCPYPWLSLRIAANGDVVACCRDLQHKTVLGNLLYQEIPEVWNGKAMQVLRRNLINKRPDLSNACNNCDLPYDSSKFTMKNLFAAAKGRLQLFVK